MAELALGLLLTILSVRYVIWMRTDSDAGYLMILGVFLLFGAFAGIAFGTAFLLGGVSGLVGLRWRFVARLIGLAVGAVLAAALWN